MPLPRPAAFVVDAQGQRFRLGDHFVVGRLASCDYPVPSGAVTRRHLALSRQLDGGFFAEDLGSSNGSVLNERPLRVAVLAAGDTLTVPDATLRFECEPVPEPRLSDDLALVARAADLESALAVWLDERVERGDDFAQALRQSEIALGERLQTALAEGALVLRWRNGFVREASVRCRSPGQLLEVLRAVFDHPLCQFVSTLRLQTFFAHHGLQRLALPALESLRLGPLWGATEESRVREALSDVVFACAPRLQAPVFERYTEAWLEQGGAVIPLRAGRAEQVGAFTVRSAGGAWHATPNQRIGSVRHNGRAVASAELYPGDRLGSAGAELTFFAR